ncbi:hypothetical protein ACFV0C_20135 [Streptomyces sp. NPDC059568]|uniref:hypothetical protein n=1 Tax=Streptomyces sp. NPDC059568 TaxID=3346868 RepID=UPI0036976A3D
MSATAWQWRDGGSGPGHLQRVLVVVNGRFLAEYNAWLAHTQECATCSGADGRCENGRTLWTTYTDARNDA